MKLTCAKLHIFRTATSTRTHRSLIENLKIHLHRLPIALFFVAPLVHAAAISDLQAGHWYEVPGAKLETVFPTPTPPGMTGPRSVMDAWSGGAYDSVRDRLIVWGGGHCDYAGNEIYVFDIETSVWTRLTEPSTQIVEGVSHYPDGLPSSRHTYDSLSFVPETGEFVSIASGGYFCETNGNYERATDIFNFALNRWERGANFPDIGGSTGSVSAYDPVTGHIWLHGTGGNARLAEYDPIADTWQRHGSAIYLEIDGVAAIDSNRHRMIVVGGYNGNNGLMVWDLDNPGAGHSKPSSSGARNLENVQAPGLVYDPVADLYVGWNGGSDVYTLDPDTWVWSRVSPASSNAVQGPAKNPNGTYGRFQYIPSKNAYIVVSRTGENVFYYKLTDGAGQAPGDPAPSIDLSANPLQVMPGDFATISWSTADASSCTASGSWAGNKAVSSNGEAFNETVGPLNTDSSFTLDCEGPGGSTSASLTIIVQNSAPTPTVNFTSSESTVVEGSFVTLNWTSANTVDCTASGDWTGSKSLSGSEQVGPLSQTSNYVLSCNGDGGTVLSSVTVQVESATAQSPSLDFNSNSLEVAPGDSVLLSWQATNADSCQASGAWSGDKATTGSESTGAINNDSTYVQTCTGGNASVSKSVTIRVRQSTPGTGPGTSAGNLSSGGGAFGWLWLACLSILYAGARSRHVLLVCIMFALAACNSETEDSSNSGGIAEPPTVTLNADATQVQSGDSVTLTWSTDDAQSCEASGGWSGNKQTAGQEQVGPLSQSTTFILSCTGPGGTGSATFAVTVEGSLPAPAVTLLASPTTVQSGQAAELSWSSQNARTCTASGGWNGSRALSGTESTGALTATSNYTLSCSGDGGENSATVTVAVSAQGSGPTLDFSASPTTVAMNQSATLAWTAGNADSCTASGDWSGDRAVSGSESTGSLNENSSFKLSCSNAFGNIERTVVVNVSSGTPSGAV
ncbi:MAG TPA: hypothetical protein PKK10_18425, partial [Woeseiaceae bacterium]|nr:hypothetical protein [Woeseiaceae bacterium]